MSMKTVVMALVFGIAVAMGARLLTGRTGAATDVDMTDVVMVVQEVPKGKKLTAEMLETRRVATQFVPPGALSDVEKAAGRMVAIPVPEGMILLDSFLVPEDAAQRLTSLIPQGMRAVTISTPTQESSVARLVQPGDHVDVQMTLNSRDRHDLTGGAQTFILQENLEVLALDDQLDTQHGGDDDSSSRHYKSVTLLATPSQAMRLNLGQSRGELQLVLRPDSADEDQATEHVPLTLNQLIGRQAPETEPASTETSEPVESPEATLPPALPSIVTYRGTTRGLVSLRPASMRIASSQPRETTVSPAENWSTQVTLQDYREVDDE